MCLPAALLAVLLPMTAPLWVGTAARADDGAKYDEFGLRPPEGDSGLALPDPVLDPRWPMPDPGRPAPKPERLDSDEDRLDPLHDDGTDEEAPPAPRVPSAPPAAAPEPVEPSVEEVLKQGPSGPGLVAPAPDRPFANNVDDDRRGSPPEDGDEDPGDPVPVNPQEK